MDTRHPYHPLRWALVAVAAAVVVTLLGIAVKIGNDTASYLATSTVQAREGVQTDSANPFTPAPAVATAADAVAQEADAAATSADTRRDDAADLARPAALVAAAN